MIKLLLPIIMFYYNLPDDQLVWFYYSVKIHDLTEMKEIYSIITIEDAGGNCEFMI